MTPLIEVLVDRFDATPVADIEATVRLDFANDDLAILLRIDNKGLQAANITDTPSQLMLQRADLVIYLSSHHQLRQLLDGTRTPLKEFQSGGLRSSGYIIWVFRILASFSPPLSQ